MGKLSLGDARALCVLLADRDTTRYSRAAMKWLGRFALETPNVSLEETRLFAAALAALPLVSAAARPLLPELASARGLVSVRAVFDDFISVE
jgi:hypothetical protein